MFKVQITFLDKGCCNPSKSVMGLLRPTDALSSPLNDALCNHQLSIKVHSTMQLPSISDQSLTRVVFQAADA